MNVSDEDLTTLPCDQARQYERAVIKEQTLWCSECRADCPFAEKTDWNEYFKILENGFVKIENIEGRAVRLLNNETTAKLESGNSVGVAYDYFCGILEFYILDTKYKKLFGMPIEKEDIEKLRMLFSTVSLNVNEPKEEKNMKKNMPFRQAWFELLNGKKIRLSSWKGYWAWENNTIMMHCADGTVLDIRKTDNPAFTFSNIATDDWEVVEE